MILSDGKRFSALLENVQKAERGVSKSDLQKAIIGRNEKEEGNDEAKKGNKMGDKIKTAFAHFFKKWTGDTFMVLLRGSGTLDALFPLNVNYHSNETKGYYYVGKSAGNGKSVDTKISTASNVREVQILRGERLVFADLLNTLNVDFVKYGDLTVLPFPFKYLREWLKTKR